MVGITESWATAEVDGAELGISGYVLFRKDRLSTVEKRGEEFCYLLGRNCPLWNSTL